MVNGSWAMVLSVALLCESGKAERRVHGSWFFAEQSGIAERRVHDMNIYPRKRPNDKRSPSTSSRRTGDNRMKKKGEESGKWKEERGRLESGVL